jgi:outer membrane protein assembly factor BamE (lipoprotein component of BamABCDE complex)
MKYTIPSLLLAAACTFTGCSSPGQAYAKRHSELSPAQVQIMNTGKVPDGTAVAGMTREAVQLALGEPTQYTKVDGHDAWVYVQKRLSTFGISSANDATFNRRDLRSQHSLAEGESHAPQDQQQTKTTIHFDGDRATRAEVVNGSL